MSPPAAGSRPVVSCIAASAMLYCVSFVSDNGSDENVVWLHKVSASHHTDANLTPTTVTLRLDS